MTVLVTGATGHIGINLLHALSETDEPIRVLIRREARVLDGFPVEKATGDVLDADSLARALDGVRTVYHLAGHISLDGDPEGRMQQVNVIGVRNVVAACLGSASCRLVHFSSVHALCGKPPGGVVDETTALVQGNRGDIAYDVSKANGEREVRKGLEQGLDAIILNPTGVIGPEDHRPSQLGRTILDLCQGTLPALVKGGFNWVDVRDVAQGALAAAEKGRTGERYLLSGHFAPVVELADLVARHSGTPRPRLVCPLGLARIGAPVATRIARWSGTPPRFTSDSLSILDGHRFVSHQKATDELGYTPRPLADTVADTVAWFRRDNRF